VRWQRFVAVLVVAADIGWLAVLMGLSGGVGSGLDGFVLVTVTAGAIVLFNRTSLLTAALATIAVLYQELYTTLVAPAEPSGFFQAGVLGAVFFAATLVIQNLSNRLRQNELRNLSQAAELADLERINQLVIQRMQTGIVVVDENNFVRTSNQSANRLLGQTNETSGAPLPSSILEGLQLWRQNRIRGLPALQLENGGPNVRISFSPVRLNDPQGFATIFIEDNGEIEQQAQQLKLSELGRLSASIAHEICNPLAAISHAAQLLQESRNLDRGDNRLTTIIHNHTQRMNAVVENVLLLSRRQPPNPERIRLRELVEYFRREFSEAESGVTFHVDIAPPETEVRVDVRQIKQVLTNLATNAQRHGGATATEVRFSGRMPSSTFRRGLRGDCLQAVFIRRRVVAHCNHGDIKDEIPAGKGVVEIHLHPVRFEGTDNSGGFSSRLAERHHQPGLERHPCKAVVRQPAEVLGPPEAERLRRRNAELAVICWLEPDETTLKGLRQVAITEHEARRFTTPGRINFPAVFEQQREVQRHPHARFNGMPRKRFTGNDPAQGAPRLLAG